MAGDAAPRGAGFDAAPPPARVCVYASGETTVTLDESDGSDAAIVRLHQARARYEQHAAAVSAGPPSARRPPSPPPSSVAKPISAESEKDRLI